MTDKQPKAGPAGAGPAPGDERQASGSGELPTERVVIRDKRKVGRNKPAQERPGDSGAAQAKTPADADPVEPGPAATDEAAAKDVAEPAAKDVAEPAAKGPAAAASGPDAAGPDPAVTGATATGEVASEEAAEAEPATGTAALGAELEALRADLDERTRDLQRVSAEYANYRKRVDRDRALVGEQATGAVLTTLLPVLDDLDRAREHGDLVGPFAAVAEQLIAALSKFGLEPFGENGDPFDPNRHEAVAHTISAEVDKPTCIDVMRRGYLLGDRLLRPALVAVADPE